MIEELRRLRSFADANDATLALLEADSKDTFSAWSRHSRSNPKKWRLRTFAHLLGGT
ncbi:hypothetical protein AB4Y44_27980 [Paraburkholderia sp. BR10937]|uniref:hypothetical protein n=1 Tax=Paraburkholderia sp. BR10937 TaxID=3236994 RepID=UPI0034D29C58